MTATKRNKIIASIFSLVHFCVTFFTDRFVFDAFKEGLGAEALTHYIICKIVLFVLIFAIWNNVVLAMYELYECIMDGKPLSGRLLVIKYAALYLIPIAAVLFFKLPEGFLSNDETLIFAEASSLHTYTWFYYLTTYYYIVTMMLIPSWLGPVLCKVALQVLVCGYFVYRLRKHLKGKWLLFAYVPFVIMPVLAYTTSAHRIPVYYLLYLLLIFTLVIDKFEDVKPSILKLSFMAICAALLTQWRTEGIYMLVLFPILALMVYGKYFLEKGFAKKRILIFFLGVALVQYLFTVPQNGFVADRLSDQADNRMKPFYAYTMTNMYRNGLDFEINAEAMENIWRYIDKDTLNAINRDLGDINYEDVLILYYPGYTGVKGEATDEDYRAFVKGCKDLFLNNPQVLLKTRIGAFLYAALPYKIEKDGDGIKGLVKLGFSTFKSLSYNLLLPCFFMLCVFVYSLYKKKWLYFFITGGLICHFIIVFVLAPASYFKYYFPIYMLAWTGCIIRAAFLLQKKFSGNKSEGTALEE